MSDMNDFNEGVIKEFRENNGKVGGMFDGAPMLILTTTGAKSGMPRTNPLMYLPHGDNYVIFASKGGAPQDPAWFKNITAYPVASIEVGTDTINVDARVAADAERDDLYNKQAELFPQFKEYEEKTDRLIPVVILIPQG